MPIERKIVTANGQRTTCPHLGLPNDHETWLAFASTGNHCHHTAKPQSANFTHQQAYCLSANHVNCPVFQQPAGKKFPLTLQLTPSATPSSPFRLGNLLITLALILAVGAGIWLIQNQSATPTALPEPSNTAVIAILPDDTPTPTATNEPTATPTTTPIPPTFTQAPPTQTATPTATPTDEPTATATITPIPPTATPRLPQITVIVNELNVRTGPGTAYTVIAQVPRDTQFDVIGQNNGRDWWQICCLDGDVIGWIFKESVILDDETVTIPIASEIPTPPPATLTP